MREAAGTRNSSSPETTVLTSDNYKANRGRVRIGISLLGALLTAVTALFVFGWLSEEVLEGATQHFDAFVRNAIHQVSTPGLTLLMHAFSVLGSVAVITVLSLSAVCAFVCLHRSRTAALLAITMLGVGVLDITLKHAFHRDRPVAFFGMSPSSYSFPSGHALGSLCFYGVLAAILSARVRGRGVRLCIWSAAVVLIAMIGLSRVYLGVHYPSDVIAGYCAAAVWGGTIVFVEQTLELREQLSRKVVGPTDQAGG